MSADRTALVHSRLPLGHWYFAVLDAVNKYNAMKHGNWLVGTQGMAQRYPGFTITTMFWRIGTTPVRQKMTKVQERALSYIYVIDTTKLVFLELFTTIVHKSIATEFNPIHYATDPA